MQTMLPSKVRELRDRLENRINDAQEIITMTQQLLTKLQSSCPHSHMKELSPAVRNAGDMCEDCGKVWTREEIDNWN